MINLKAYTAEPHDTDVPEYIGITLLGMIFLPVLVLVLSLMLKLGDVRWTLCVLSALPAPLLCHKLLKSPSRTALYAAWVVPPCLIAFAFVACAHVYDTSYDGMTYHAEAVLGLLKGYNPYHGSLLEPSQPSYEFWVNHYPKVPWFFGAIVAHATGNFQAGKSYHMLLASAVLFYAYAFFRQRWLTPGNAALLAIASAMNPVVICQMFSYYVDSALASLLTLLWRAAFS